jgi:hypothetical protein
MLKYLIGIDDTDNLQSRGTGFLVRTLGQLINEKGLGITGGITRHQLLFDPRVPYTSHNSSACLEVETNQPVLLWDFMIDYLEKNCASGSDCGLCMIESSKIPTSIIEWGNLAKVELVNKQLALQLAKAESIKLVGLTGTHDGVIGAMAGVGLRASGNDGRFVNLKGVDIRSITGISCLKNLKEKVEIHQAVTMNNEIIDDFAPISLDGGWFRPVLKNGLITLILNNTKNYELNSYELADKEYIKSISN